MSNVSNQSWAFTIFRVVVGSVFLAHGIQKFFMYGLHGVAGAFGSMGVPVPAVTSVLVAVVELARRRRADPGVPDALGGRAQRFRHDRCHPAGPPEKWLLQSDGHRVPVNLAGGVHRDCDPRAGSGVG